MFKRLDEDEALIVENGVYKPAEIYAGPGQGLYIKAKGGFVRIKRDGSTSHPTVRLQTLMREGPIYQDTFGRVCYTEGEGRREMEIQIKDGLTLIKPIKALPKPTV